MKEDIIEPSKFSCEAGYKLGMEDFLRKSFERTSDSKKKTKSEGSNKKSKSQAIESLREKTDTNSRIFSHKNSIAKASRPGTSMDKSHLDHAQNSVDHHHHFTVISLEKILNNFAKGNI